MHRNSNLPSPFKHVAHNMAILEDADWLGADANDEDAYTLLSECAAYPRQLMEDYLAV